MNNILEETVFLSVSFSGFFDSVKENEKEDTDEVVIEFFEKEMEEKLSANDIDRSHRLGKKTNRK